jgi:hypothetical protein
MVKPKVVGNIEEYRHLCASGFSRIAKSKIIGLGAKLQAALTIRRPPRFPLHLAPLVDLLPDLAILSQRSAQSRPLNTRHTNAK